MSIAQKLIGLSRGSFDPLSIAGLAAWWDFSDATKLYTDAGVTLVASDGDAIGRAADKSGNGKHLNQASGTEKPAYKVAIKNGRSIGRFDGTGDILASTPFTLATANTVFIVVSKTGGSGNQWLWENASDDFTAGLLIQDANIWLWYANAADGGVALGGAVTGFNTVVSKISSAAAATGYTNGGAGAASFDPKDTYLTGVNFYLGGPSAAGFIAADIGEVLIYSAALTNSQLDTVGAYLASKWGLTWTAVS